MNPLDALDLWWYREIQFNFLGKVIDLTRGETILGCIGVLALIVLLKVASSASFWSGKIK